MTICGIGGRLSFDGSTDPALGERMTDCIAHRGSNDEGVYAAGPIVLAHHRLSILDLSDAGH